MRARAGRDRGRRPGLLAGAARRRAAASGREPGVPAGGGVWAVVERGGQQLRFRPGGDVADLRGGRWELEGELAVLDGDGRGRAAAQRRLPGPAGPRLVGADARRTPATSSSPLALGYEARRLGRRHPRRRRQPRLAASPATRSGRCSSSAAARSAAGRARAVDAARRGAGGPRALRPEASERLGSRRPTASCSALLLGARAAAACGAVAAAGAPSRRSAAAQATESPTATRRWSRSAREHPASDLQRQHGRRQLGGRLLRRRRARWRW